MNACIKKGLKWGFVNSYPIWDGNSYADVARQQRSARWAREYVRCVFWKHTDKPLVSIQL